MAKRKAKKTTKKRKAAASATGRVPRKTPYTSDEMREVVEQIRELAAQIAALAKSMDESGVDKVVIDGHAMLLRGLNQIANFADNGARAVRQARTPNWRR